MTFNADGKAMEHSENNWGFVERTGTDGTVYYQTILNSNREEGYKVTTETTAGSLSVEPVIMKSMLTENQFDQYGNATEVKTTTTGLGEYALTEVRTITNEYSGASINLANWDNALSYPELGRLTKATGVTVLNGLSTTRTTAFSYYGNGLLQTETVEPLGEQDKTLTTTHTYNSMGNALSVTTEGWDGDAVVTRSVRNEYDATGRYMTASFNHYDQRLEHITARNGFGSPTQMQDLAGITTTIEYDALGRESRRFDDSADEIITSEYLSCASLTNCPTATSYAIQQTLATGGASIEYFDILGRTIREGSINFNGRWVYTDTEYDALGRAIRTSEPFFANLTPLWNTTSFDILGRPWKVIAADGSKQTMAYSGLTITTTNDFGQKNTETNNVLDQLVKVVDNLGGKIGYEYNIDGELTRMHSYRANGELAATTVLDYDNLGRKTQMIDPDKGTWVYSYNAFGELIEQTDAKGQKVTERYDALGRMLKRTDYKAGNAIEGYATWVYDNNTRIGPELDNARGQLRQVVLSQAIAHTTCESATTQQCVTYEYDEVGRQAGSEMQLGTAGSLGSYRNSIDYDNFGRPTIAYDVLDGVVSYTANSANSTLSGTRTLYNNYGFASETRDLQNDVLLHRVIEQDARGQITDELKGNGAHTFYQYDPATGRLLNQTTDIIGLFAIQDINYAWDNLGNLLHRHNQSAIAGGSGQNAQKNVQESFCYDGLNRLIKTNQGTTATNLCGGLASEQDQEYDSLGNIIRKRDVGTYTYAHSNNTPAANDAGLHAVTATSDGYTYRYDNNGNMIEDRKNGAIERALHYTTFDKPDNITKGQHNIQFAYGYDRSRYWRQDTDKDGVVTTTLYLGGVERISKSDSNNIEWKRYLGDTIITVTTDSANNQIEHEALYVYKDHLGSTDILTNDAGLVVQSMSFDPWGQRRNATSWEPLTRVQLVGFDNSNSTKGFTGHEHLDEVGLIHMNGRIYDPRLGRFLQADPFVQAPSDTQMLNRYSYVRNNPLNATDPSGYFLTAIVGIALAAFKVNAVVSAIIIGFTAAIQAVALGATPGDALRAGIIAGASAFAFNQIGANAQFQSETLNVFNGTEGLINFAGNELTAGQIAQQISLHGLVGGVSSDLQGGKFGHGFFSASFTKGVIGAANFNLNDQSTAAIARRTATAAIVGGTVSEVTGGKFANGAATAAIGHLFNGESESFGKKVRDFFTEGEDPILSITLQRKIVKVLTVDGDTELVPSVKISREINFFGLKFEYGFGSKLVRESDLNPIFKLKFSRKLKLPGKVNVSATVDFEAFINKSVKTVGVLGDDFLSQTRGPATVKRHVEQQRKRLENIGK